MSYPPLPPLSMLRTFEAAGRNGSFKHAAEELAVSPTAVSHQIRKLEVMLGMQLFDRSKREIALTREGEILLTGMSEAMNMIQRSVRNLQGRKRGEVVIGATPAFASRWLMPRLARLGEALPDVDIKLRADLRPTTVGRDVDIAIRYGYGSYSGLESRVLAADRFSAMANPVLGIRTVSDLATTPRLEFEWEMPAGQRVDWTTWLAECAKLERRVDWTPLREIAYSDEGDALQAAVAGQGVVLASHVLTKDDRANNRLQVIEDSPILDGPTFHILADPQSMDAASRQVFDWLVDEASNRSGSESENQDVERTGSSKESTAERN